MNTLNVNEKTKVNVNKAVENIKIAGKDSEVKINAPVENLNVSGEESNVEVKAHVNVLNVLSKSLINVLDNVKILQLVQMLK